MRLGETDRTEANRGDKSDAFNSQHVIICCLPLDTDIDRIMR